MHPVSRQKVRRSRVIVHKFYLPRLGAERNSPAPGSVTMGHLASASGNSSSAMSRSISDVIA